jgi:hypothetical protein
MICFLADDIYKHAWWAAKWPKGTPDLTQEQLKAQKN